jgi:cytochrome o ubiquinol oxidase operon protein cyoD
MSADTHAHESHGPHISRRGYLTGFALAAILTAIPFWLTMTNVIANHQITALLVVLFAAVQIVVHMIYFLHMDARAEAGWSLMALLFTVLLVGIALSGSLWVMYHLTTNMMPSMVDMRQAP